MEIDGNRLSIKFQLLPLLQKFRNHQTCQTPFIPCFITGFNFSIGKFVRGMGFIHPSTKKTKFLLLNICWPVLENKTLTREAIMTMPHGCHWSLKLQLDPVPCLTCFPQAGAGLTWRWHQWSVKVTKWSVMQPEQHAPVLSINIKQNHFSWTSGPLWISDGLLL